MIGLTNAANAHILCIVHDERIKSFRVVGTSDYLCEN